ncbi:glycosyl transferase [Sulfolobales archaeon HS-7]|nr:glycosyl transferase [Sulfolobales archaeon HS-7]
MLLFDLGVLITSLHFVQPIGYYSVISKRKLSTTPTNRPLPLISIIIPTYNERARIRKKLKNVFEKTKGENVEVIIIDSSKDGIEEELREFSDVKLIKQQNRTGKIHAVKEAMRQSKGDIVVVTDADAIWIDPLSNALSYLNGKVGAVTCVKHSYGELENSYRDFYNDVRVGESAMFSTPIFNGEMVAFNRNLITPEEIPTVGADDSTIATLLSLKGYRAISIPTMRVVEESPKKILEYLSWKTRRGSHLVRHFLRNVIKVMRSSNKDFKIVFAEETYLHTVGPWFLIIGLSLMLFSAPVITMGVIAIASLFMVNKRFRKIALAWIPNQIALILSQFFAMKGEVIVWRKELK